MAEPADRMEATEATAVHAEAGRESGEPAVLVDSVSMLMVVGGIPAMSLFFVVLFLLTAAFDLPF